MKERELEILEFLAKERKLESMKKEIQHLEDQIFKNKYGIKKSDLDKLSKYFKND